MKSWVFLGKIKKSGCFPCFSENRPINLKLRTELKPSFYEISVFGALIMTFGFKMQDFLSIRDFSENLHEMKIIGNRFEDILLPRKFKKTVREWISCFENRFIGANLVFHVENSVLAPKTVLMMRKNEKRRSESDFFVFFQRSYSHFRIYSTAMKFSNKHFD